MPKKSQNESRLEIRQLVSCPPAKVMVTGPHRTGKHDFISLDLRALTSESDFLEVDGTIDGARQSQNFIKTTPITGDFRIVLVDGRKNLTEPAQDAYLKICEDTPESSSIVIVVNDDQLVRPALTSRMDHVWWCPMDRDEMVAFMSSSEIQEDDFIVNVVRGRHELCKPISSNMDEMKRLYASACRIVAGNPDLSCVPRLILEWSKLDDDVKDVALAVCEHASRFEHGPFSGMMSRFVHTVRTVSSVNVETHWWRSCLV